MPPWYLLVLLPALVQHRDESGGFNSIQEAFKLFAQTLSLASFRALPWPCPSKKARTMFHKGHWNVSADPEVHIWLMNALHCESVSVFAACGYPVKGWFVYVNWKDWSVTELLPLVKQGWRSQAFQGQPGEPWQPGVCGRGWDEVGRKSTTQIRGEEKPG